MAFHNQLTLIGNILSDMPPQLPTTRNGKPYLRIIIGDSRRRQNQQTGQWENAESWSTPCVIWGDMAANVHANLRKGSRVIVVGQMNPNTYTDRTTSQKKYGQELAVEEIAPSMRFGIVRFSVERRQQQGGGYGSNPSMGYAAPAGQGYGSPNQPLDPSANPYASNGQTTGAWSATPGGPDDDGDEHF